MTILEATGRTAGATARAARAAAAVIGRPFRDGYGAFLRAGRRLGQAFREQYEPEGGSLQLEKDEATYRRFTQSGKRDLSPITQERQLAIAHWLWQSNPLARRILELLTDFVIGEGAQLRSLDRDVELRLTHFWRSAINQMDLFQEQLTLELAKSGELIVPAFVNETNGAVSLGWIDPSRVAGVLVDETNCRCPVAIKLRPRESAAGTAAGTTEYLHVIREETDPSRPGYGYLMPAQPGDVVKDKDAALGGGPSPAGFEYAGSAFLFQINKSPAATRGTSDLLPLADWLDSFDQVQWATLDRANLLNAFIWDVTLANATQDEIDRFLRDTPPPKPATVRAHNEKVTWKAETPDLKLGDMSTGVRMFVNHIMGGAGLPAHWYGASDDVNRATAAEMGPPTFRRLAARQRRMIHILTTICQFALDQHVVHKALPEQVPVLDPAGNPTGESIPTREAFSIVLPEVSAPDTARVAAAIKDASQAVGNLLDLELLSRRTARRLVATLLEQLGERVNQQEEDEELEREQAARAEAEMDTEETRQARLAADLAAAAAGASGNGRVSAAEIAAAP